jgi:hypothetical protein
VSLGAPWQSQQREMVCESATSSDVMLWGSLPTAGNTATNKAMTSTKMVRPILMIDLGSYL